MIEFVLHPDVQQDCRRISAKNPASWNRILAVLSAVEEDEVLLSHLTDHAFRTYGDFDIGLKRWATAGKLGFELRRFRFFALEENGINYRVVYAVDTEDEYCYILAILRKDEINYDDPNDPFTKRILSAYAALGI